MFAITTVVPVLVSSVMLDDAVVTDMDCVDVFDGVMPKFCCAGAGPASISRNAAMPPISHCRMEIPRVQRAHGGPARRKVREGVPVV